MQILKPEHVHGLPLNRVRLSANLCLHEYIPFSLYKRYVTPGDKYFGWGDNFLYLLCRKIDHNLVASDQKLCDQFGPVIINNWWNGGSFNNRGFRVNGCGVGTELSDHYQGRASDKSFVNYSAEEVREYIQEHWQALGISIIESDVTWVHTSVAWIPNQTQLKIVKP